MNQSGLFFEDYVADQQWETATRTITEYDILQFVTLTGMNEALFLDETYIRDQTAFTRRIAPGALTLAYAEGLIISSGYLSKTGIAFLGLQSEIHAPVYLGDTLRVHMRLLEKRDVSKPDRGLVTTENQVLNQDACVVLTYQPKRLIRRREPLPSPA